MMSACVAASRSSLPNVSNDKISRRSPNPPSIVSLAASEAFDTTGFSDPEQLLPSELSDLFEGALCDDELNEIPNLLNLACNAPCSSEPPMMLHAIPQTVSSYSAPAPSSTGPVEIVPAQTGSSSEQPTPSAGSSPFLLVPAPHNIPCNNKRGYSQPIMPAASSSSKRQKLPALVMNPVPNPTVVLQSIRPLTQLPPSMEVNGTNHVNNAGASANANNVNHQSNKKNGVNTSTNHIKALTGANGAAVCLEAIEKALQKATNPNSSQASTAASSLTGASSDGGGAADQHLSAEEKAKQSRDRNRQHARNTRVRKKAYVEELKRTLNHLVEERDGVLQQRRVEQHGVLEQRDVRFRVLEDFLNLRGRNETDPMRWSLILEESFCFRLPRADIPGVVCSSGGPDAPDSGASNSGANQSYPLGMAKKVLTGVNEVMEDSRMVSNLLQSLGASSMSVSYECDRESFMMDDASVVLNWVATSSGAVSKGATAEFTIQGKARARFNPLSNKLLALEFTF